MDGGSPSSSESRVKKHWTLQEDNYIRWHWADDSLHKIASALGRTFDGVACRAIVLGLRAPAHRGVESIKSIERRTGYGSLTIRRACKKLGIFPREPIITNLPRGRAPSRRRVLTGEQVEMVVAFLDALPHRARVVQTTTGTWNERGRGGFMKPPACVDCQKNDTPHYARGRCKRCHGKHYRKLKKRAAES